MNRTILLYIAGAILIWNLIVFLIYAADKHKARREKWRTPESTLLLCAFLCGGLGAGAAMRLLRHKTRHIKFRILIPVAFLLTVAALIYLIHTYLTV